MNDSFKKLVMKTLWVAIFFFGGRCLISWKTLVSSFNIYDVFGYAGEAIGVTSIIIAVYEKWLWRFNPFEDVPVLNKHYSGIIKSTYDNTERAATLEIKQTLLSAHITLITSESKSKSITASIDTILGEKQVTYCYLNTPKSECRHRSEIHFGTAMLCVDNPQLISGQYYTDRTTCGDMEFTANE